MFDTALSLYFKMISQVKKLNRQYFDLAVSYHDFLRECKPCYFLSFIIVEYHPHLLIPANYA